MPSSSVPRWVGAGVDRLGPILEIIPSPKSNLVGSPRIRTCCQIPLLLRLSCARSRAHPFHKDSGSCLGCLPIYPRECAGGPVCVLGVIARALDPCVATLARFELASIRSAPIAHPAISDSAGHGRRPCQPLGPFSVA